jgi:hypothetical protein
MMSKTPLFRLATHRDESGLASLLVIALVVMAVGISYGIVSVAENMVQKKEAAYGAQSSVNSAAYAYGQTYISQTRACIVQKVQDELDETLILPATCDAQLLQVCLDTNFQHCEQDIFLCFEEVDSFVEECSEDATVHDESFQAAKESAKSVAPKYQLQDVKLTISGETLKVSAKRDVSTQLPKFGATQKIELEAQSAFSVANRDTNKVQ